eukprot:1342757-Pleurochrysis_carterae.AAC.8
MRCRSEADRRACMKGRMYTIWKCARLRTHAHIGLHTYAHTGPAHARTHLTAHMPDCIRPVLTLALVTVHPLTRTAPPGHWKDPKLFGKPRQALRVEVDGIGDFGLRGRAMTFPGSVSDVPKCLSNACTR